MIYLSGVIKLKVAVPGQVGFMLTPNMGNRPNLSAIEWGADTGCYTEKVTFSLSKYLKWLDSFKHFEGNCLFATAPDVVGSHTATWQRSRDVLPEIRALGYKAALVAQEGFEWATVDWDAFDVLFIGGLTAKWKLSPLVSSVVKEAHSYGKWVHMGRVNSLRRIQAAVLMGCNSADGTFLARAPDINIPKIHNWFEVLRSRPFLPLNEAAS